MIQITHDMITCNMKQYNPNVIKQVNEVFESFVVSQPEIQEYNDQIKTEQDFNTLNKLLEKHLLELVIPQMKDHIQIFPKSLQKYVVNSYIDGI